MGRKSLLQKGLTRFGYDAVESSTRRRAPIMASYSEDDTLDANKRKRLVSTMRDIPRNFSLAGWGIRKHLDYVSTFNFQSRTGDVNFDKRLESLLKWWSLPENCDVAGRHSFKQMMRLLEEARTVDGDNLVVRYADGRIQCIESDRVRNPNGSTNMVHPDSKLRIIQGVEVDAQGRAVRYAISKRNANSSAMEPERWIDAGNARLLGYYDRFDQVRGISRLAPAINSFQDLYESTTYALAKAKVSQLFGLVTYRDAPFSLGQLDNPDGEGDADGYNVKFGGGPYHLDLEDGDRAEILESKTPGTEFQAFCMQVTASALKALDIPMSFYDESFTNYSGARQALLQYEQSVQAKRGDLVGVLNWITQWKLAQWVGAGLIPLPKGVQRVSDIPWEWIPAGISWIDPLKEAKADETTIGTVTNSRQNICKTHGFDFFEIADQQAQEEKYMRDIGLEGTLEIEPGAADKILEEEEEAEEAVVAAAEGDK